MLEADSAATGRLEAVWKHALLDCGLVGRSAPYRAALDQLRCIALSDAPALLEGETGSGKEMAARLVHYAGNRRERPFVPVNCGALPDTLLESELFGVERGAFTDARKSCRGLVGEAGGGTLFLDEVDALSSKAQVTLLRFLQDLRFRPLGQRQPRGSLGGQRAARVRQAAQKARHRRRNCGRLKVRRVGRRRSNWVAADPTGSACTRIRAAARPCAAVRPLLRCPGTAIAYALGHAWACGVQPSIEIVRQRAVIQSILAYLARHPAAADSAEGVVRWWLGEQGEAVSIEEIELALGSMARRGRIRAVRLADGSVLYSCSDPAAVRRRARQPARR